MGLELIIKPQAGAEQDRDNVFASGNILCQLP